MPALGVGGERGCTFAAAKLAIARQLAGHRLVTREEKRAKGGNKYKKNTCHQA